MAEDDDQAQAQAQARANARQLSSSARNRRPVIVLPALLQYRALAVRGKPLVVAGLWMEPQAGELPQAELTALTRLLHTHHENSDIECYVTEPAPAPAPVPEAQNSDSHVDGTSGHNDKQKQQNNGAHDRPIKERQHVTAFEYFDRLCAAVTKIDRQILTSVQGFLYTYAA